jgi:tetratricopeptide (TPR) repeat protein
LNSGPQPLLSAALIVRNESAFIRGCLESLSDIVDEAVVVDTGSVDGTAEIAKSLGARVVHHPWNDDFAEARNVSLEMATGQWILYIDADERLTGADRTSVRRLLCSAEEAAFRLLLRPTVNSTLYREYRLWRNDPRIRFEGIIHEKVLAGIHRVAKEDGRTIGDADLMLVHLGYEGDQARKHRRNLPLLRRQLQREPGNLFAWNHLARVLTALGERDEAEQTLERAIEIAQGTGVIDPTAVLSYADLIRLRDERGADTSGLLARARSLYPENCVLLWIEARHCIDRGEYAAALWALEQILETDWSSQPDRGPAYDRELMGEAPLSAKGLCLFRMGEYEQAAQAYRAAASCSPHDAGYEVKAQLAVARARRAQTAEAALPSLPFVS